MNCMVTTHMTLSGPKFVLVFSPVILVSSRSNRDFFFSNSLLCSETVSVCLSIESTSNNFTQKIARTVYIVLRSKVSFSWIYDTVQSGWYIPGFWKVVSWHHLVYGECRDRMLCLDINNSPPDCILTIVIWPFYLAKHQISKMSLT
jgi:hypothetical protein